MHDRTTVDSWSFAIIGFMIHLSIDVWPDSARTFRYFVPEYPSGIWTGTRVPDVSGSKVTTWIIIGSDRRPETKQGIEGKIDRFRSGRFRVRVRDRVRVRFRSPIWTYQFWRLLTDRRSELNTVLTTYPATTGVVAWGKSSCPPPAPQILSFGKFPSYRKNVPV